MRIGGSRVSLVWIAAFGAMGWSPQISGQPRVLQSGDLYRLRAVSQVEFSPDGKRIAYGVQSNGRTGRPSSQVWILDLASGRSTRLGDEKGATNGPRWSPDGQWVAYWESGAKSDAAKTEEKESRYEPVVQHELLPGGPSRLIIARPDGTGATSLAVAAGTNHDLPRADRSGLAW